MKSVPFFHSIVASVIFKIQTKYIRMSIVIGNKTWIIKVLNRENLTTNCIISKDFPWIIYF